MKVINRMGVEYQLIVISLESVVCSVVDLCWLTLLVEEMTKNQMSD